MTDAFSVRAVLVLLAIGFACSQCELVGIPGAGRETYTIWVRNDSAEAALVLVEAADQPSGSPNRRRIYEIRPSAAGFTVSETGPWPGGRVALIDRACGTVQEFVPMTSGGVIVIPRAGRAVFVSPEQAFPEVGQITAISSNEFKRTDLCGGTIPEEP